MSGRTGLSGRDQSGPYTWCDQSGTYSSGLRKETSMRRVQAWQMLCVIFAVFWLLFAVVLIGFSGFPFYVISIALTTILALSLLIIALAWAYQNNV